MDASTIANEWRDKTLTTGQIAQYLEENLRALCYHDRDVVIHVADLCHAIYMWDTEQCYYLGEFLCAVVQDSLTMAVHTADDVNRRALWLYVGFLHNCCPGGRVRLRDKV